MKRLLTALAVGLAIAGSASAATAQETIQNRWMGDATCGGWRAAPSGFDNIQKAALLNWVLGYLSGRTDVRGDDVLATVEVSSIAAWVDNYCANNPLDYLVTAAFELEKVLIARRRG